MGRTGAPSIVKKPLHERLFHTRDDIAPAVNHEMSKFTHGEASGIKRIPHYRQWTVYALGDYFEGLRVCTSLVFFLN